jgi:hypothetical protein
MKYLFVFLLLGCITNESTELKELKELKKECEQVKKELDALGAQVLPKLISAKMNKCMQQDWWKEKNKKHWDVTD